VNLPPPPRNQPWEWALVTALLAALSVAYLWPLPTVLSTHVPGDQRDPLLNAALLDHVFRSLATLQWGRVWDAPIFFPYRNTLAFSESFLGTAWYGIPLWLLTPDPVALHNTFHIMGLFLSSMAALFLGAALTGSVWLGAITGVLFGLGPFHLVHGMHVQMHQAWGVPLAFLGLWWVARGGERARWGWVVAAVSVALQVLSASYLGLFTMVIALPSVLVVAWQRRGTWRADLPVVGLAALAAGILLVIPVMHYQQLARELAFERSLNDIRYFSAQWGHVALLPGGLSHPPSWLQVTRDGEFTQWPGRVAPVLVVLGVLWVLVRRRAASQYGVMVLCLLSAGMCLVLARGPGPTDGVTWSHPYSALMAWVPGFMTLRVPSRFYGIMMLALGVGAALALRWIVPSSPWVQRAAGLVAALACAWDVWPGPTPIFPLPDSGNMGPVLADLAASSNPGPITELPYRLYWRSAQHDLNTTRHKRTTTNGYSGVEPPLGLALRYLLPSYPLSRTDELVTQLGVHALVLHRGPPRTDPNERAPFLEEMLQRGESARGLSAPHMNTPFGAWFDVEAAAPGPMSTLSPVWNGSVKACAVHDGGLPSAARVDIPLTHVAVATVNRHPMELDGAGSAVMDVPPVGMLDTWVGGLRVPLDAKGLRPRGDTGPFVPITHVNATGPANGVTLTHNVPDTLRTAQGLWVRVEATVTSGVLRAADHDVRIAWMGPQAETRPMTLALRNDGGAGCPAVAEGVVEFVKGQGPGTLRVILTPKRGGVVATLDTPLMLK
jgi:hypothetical protein